MRLASAYCLRNEYIIHPMSMTVDGVWVRSDPITRLSLTVDTSEIGKAVLLALDESVTGVPHPSPDAWKLVQAKFLKSVGSRSTAAFHRDSELVEIKEESGTVTLTPLVKRADRRGHRRDEARKTSTSREDHERLGEQLRKLFGTMP